MPFDPLVNPDHYVVGDVPKLFGPNYGWTVFQPGVINMGRDGKPARIPIYIQNSSGGYIPLAFDSQANAENFAAAMNHGKYLCEEQNS